eukprot:Selendium_serpulae@DN6147_c1_g3_i1.p1
MGSNTESHLCEGFTNLTNMTNGQVDDGLPLMTEFGVVGREDRVPLQGGAVDVEAQGDMRDEDFAFAELGQLHYQPGGRSKDGSEHATDEVFNAASHLAGALLSVLGLGVLVVKSSIQGKVWHVVSMSIFGVMSISLFFCSFLHHGLHWRRFDYLFRTADYVCIYLMIAGTFTPLCLVFMHDCWQGWTFFGAVWLMAVLGVASQSALGERIPKWLSNTVYGVMGSLGFFIAPALFPFLRFGGLALLGLGGVAYIGGAVVFNAEKPNPFPGRFGFHEIWHLCVLAGAGCHWALMYFYVQPFTSTSGTSAC